MKYEKVSFELASILLANELLKKSIAEVVLDLGVVQIAKVTIDSQPQLLVINAAGPCAIIPCDVVTISI